ncbi:type 1 glutamine amidotransferase domain-containing protein [Erwinia sp. HR93]|uniref:type 1 glutamine amidotransferase domain-containing protein n=1 Tax=Erwinia sp. HR93 TaxID=3094840 RepID=UPI002ADEDB09|nr:type 1 glutamine amidotransferase domain-containing protein [Erwinia sp. HR93]MEA1063400.1 type 1 glutamine amidotransferase domain-containing protein [Erwinia sp. HR93]
MSKKVAVLITDEFEDSEFTSPADALRQAGHEVVTIDTERGKTITGKQGKATVTIDAAIDESRSEDFDALLLPGGHSPDSLRADERFVEFTREMVNAHKPVFAICHGPQLLISADVVCNRKMTSVNAIAVDLKNAGVDFYDREVVVDDGQIVTSRTPDDLPAFNREMLKLLS